MFAETARKLRGQQGLRCRLQKRQINSKRRGEIRQPTRLSVGESCAVAQLPSSVISSQP